MFVLVEGGSHHNLNSIGQAQYRSALSQLFRMKEPPTDMASDENTTPAVPARAPAPAPALPSVVHHRNLATAPSI
jgi:hypothetical protein